MHNGKSAFKLLTYIMRSITLHKTSYIYKLKMSCLQLSPFKRGNTWNQAECHMFFNGLFSMYIFDILNIPS
jgi:hypothetical protein